jgi:hypothetical protein
MKAMIFISKRVFRSRRAPQSEAEGLLGKLVWELKDKDQWKATVELLATPKGAPGRLNLGR